jgi:molybdate-binding protein/DNA-binding XRE family transcriptional regulator
VNARVRNTLLAERTRRGWSQARMAEAAGVTRQSYAAVESGRAVPSTEVALRLAAALGRRVEELFRLPDRPPARERAAWGGGVPARPGQPVRRVRIGGGAVAHPVGPGVGVEMGPDAVVETVADGEVAVRPLDGPPPPDLVVVGCDPAFGVVAEILRRERGVEVLWSRRGSRAALTALARGHAHVAGTHLLDAETGRWNARWVREIVPAATTRVGFAAWEQGLVLRPEGAARVAAVADLAGSGARILNREEGSGSRMLLDAELLAAGVEPAALPGYGSRARGHEAVGEGVASGAADAGIAIEAVAAARGLSFHPLRRERYELVILDAFLDLPAVQALLDILRRPAVRTRLDALPGYDASLIGETAS